MNILSRNKLINGLTAQEISYHEDHGLVIEFHGLDVKIANLIEKTIQLRVCTVRITSIVVMKNTSSLFKYDEQISQILKAIPFRYMGPELRYRADNEVSTQNTVVLRLTKRATESRCYVFTSDLKCTDRSSEVMLTPVHEDIPIMVLKQGEEIDIYCYCEKGNGSMDVLFSPVSIACHRYMPKVMISDFGPNASIDSIVKACPVNVFDIEDGSLIVKREDNCSSCGECTRVNKLVKTSLDHNRIRMILESTKTQTEKDLLLTSLDYLIDKCNTIMLAVDSM